MHKHHHIQEIPSLKWIIKHGLDSFPTMEIYAVPDSESTPRKVNPAKIEYIDTHEIHIHFTTLKKGFAFAS